MATRPVEKSGATNAIWWIGGGAALLLFTCACCGCGGVIIGLPAMQNLRESAVRGQIAESFRSDDFMERTKDNTAVMADYNGKTIEIVGPFGRLQSNIQNQNFVTFQQSGNGHHSPRCFISDLKQARDLKPGDEIAVRGHLRIRGGLIDLSNCNISQK